MNELELELVQIEKPLTNEQKIQKLIAKLDIMIEKIKLKRK